MMNTCAVAGRKPSTPVTIGRPAATSRSGRRSGPARTGAAVPTRNSGTASHRYHRIRIDVLRSRFAHRRQPDRRQFQDEVRALAREERGGQEPDQEHLRERRRRTASPAPRTRCRRECRGSSPAAPSTGSPAPAEARRSAAPSASPGSASSSSPSCRSRARAPSAARPCRSGPSPGRSGQQKMASRGM